MKSRPRSWRHGRAFPARQETTLISGRWRSMGFFTLPAAIAAQAAMPDVPVVALAGDGGFAMTGMEFATAVQHHLPITVVVFNNGLLGEEAIKQEQAHLPVYGMNLRNPDFAAFAESAGGPGFRPRTARGLDEALQEAIRSRQPALVDVPTRFTAPRHAQKASRISCARAPMSPTSHSRVCPGNPRTPPPVADRMSRGYYRGACAPDA